MFDNSGLVKLHKMGVVMYSWIKNATKRKKGACPKCQKRKVEKVEKVQKMLSLSPSAMERLNHELAVQRDRFIRLESVKHDMALNLPHSIALPDGEELPYGSSTFLRIRDPEQEREIYEKCIRPPPNKTVFDGGSPPYRPNLEAQCRNQSRRSGDLFDRTARCFGMKRNEPPPPPPPPPPCVHVPCYRTRRITGFSESARAEAARADAARAEAARAQAIRANAARAEAARAEAARAEAARAEAARAQAARAQAARANTARANAARANAARANVALPTVSSSVPPSYAPANSTRQVMHEVHPADKMRSHSSGTAPGAAAAFAFAGTSAGAAAAIAGTSAGAAAGNASGSAAKGPEKKAEKNSV